MEPDPLDRFPPATEAAAAHQQARADGQVAGNFPLWLALDEVTDPQNFGAACRSAYFLGAAGVVTCTRNSAALTGVVSKASAGSLEVMPVHSARNLPATLQAAQNAGWQVLGAAADPGAIACGEAYLIGPTIIVV
eukprot:jgi/Astpho2/4963/gw1.00070.50.1_t